MKSHERDKILAMPSVWIDTPSPARPELHCCPPPPTPAPSCRAGSEPSPPRVAASPPLFQGSLWLLSVHSVRKPLVFRRRQSPALPSPSSLDGIAEHAPTRFPDFCPTCYAQFSIMQPERCFLNPSQMSAFCSKAPRPPFHWG